MDSKILIDIFKWCIQNPTIFLVGFVLIFLIILIVLYKLMSITLNKKYQREFERKFKAITTELGIIKTQQINGFDNFSSKLEEISNILTNRAIGNSPYGDNLNKINEISSLIKNSNLSIEEEISKHFNSSNEQLDQILRAISNISSTSSNTSPISENKLNEILTILRSLSSNSVNNTSKVSKSTRRQEKVIDDSLRSIGNIKEYN